MEINKFNYELYFVDYYEENLSARQVAELIVFLEQHADLKAEFEEYGEPESIFLAVEFKEKSSLKKTTIPTDNINEKNAEDFLVASIEGDLSFSEKEELTRFIAKNPFYAADQELYKKSSLIDESIVFESKESLKKWVVIPLWIKRASQVAAAAAIVLFVVGIFRLDSVVYSPRPHLTANSSVLDPAQNVKEFYQNLFVNQTNHVLAPKIIDEPDKVLTITSSATFSVQPDELMATNTNPNFDENIVEEPPIVFEKLVDNSSNKVEHFKTRSAEKGYQTTKQALTNFLKKRVLKEDVGIIKSHIQDLELAHTVVRSINKVFGSNLNLDPTYNNDGDLVAYALESGAFELQRNVKNK